MTELLLSIVFVGSLHISGYQSLISQTDSSPYYTSTGEHVSERGCAVSQDLLKVNGGPIEYGDLLYIDGIGFRFANDCMNKRIHKGVDIWCKNREQEHRIFLKCNKKELRVWIIRHKE